MARCRVCTRINYLLLEFHGMHDETSHSTEKAKKHNYKQITAILEISVSGKVPKTIFQLIEWCESLLLDIICSGTTIQQMNIVFALHTAYVLSHDIKDLWAMIHFIPS
jgi:hypothetical protein